MISRLISFQVAAQHLSNYKLQTKNYKLASLIYDALR
jgi:hypothetical protein